MKKNVAYKTKEKWGVRNKMRFKKRDGQHLGSEKKIFGVKSKKLVTWGIRKKMQYK